MKKILVKASKNYQITVDSGFKNFKSDILPLIKGDKVAIITDSNVEPLYYNKVKDLLDGKTVYKFVIPAGEQSKNAQTYIRLINELAKVGLSRKSTVIGLGGGVVGDLSAFIASTYMRGIAYVAIPTSLLSMVDSSVGGKTGIDLDAGKNLLGTFFQPDAVYINTDFLSTLPKREITSGLGEIMKYAFIDERITPKDIENINYEELIIKSLEIKRDIVERDEKESGDRMLLNFGHTVGHAIEKLYDYKLSHGECVIKGMYYAIKSSYSLGFMTEEAKNKAVKFLSLSGVSDGCDFTIEQILSVMKSDKKADGDEVNFVFTSGFSKAFIKKVSLKTILGSL